MNNYVLMLKSDGWCAASLCISALRLIGMLVISASIASSGIFCYETVVAIGIFVCFDQLDGMLFRCSPHASVGSFRASRRVLDSAIDRIVVQMTSISVLVSDYSYAPLFLVVLAREFIVSAPCVSGYRKGIIVYPNLVSKISVILVAFVGISYLLHVETAAYFVAALMFCSSLYVARDYVARLDLIYQGKGKLGIDYEVVG